MKSGNWNNSHVVERYIFTDNEAKVTKQRRDRNVTNKQFELIAFQCVKNAASFHTISNESVIICTL